MAKLDQKIQNAIDSIDKASTGKSLKSAIRSALVLLKDYGLPAKTLGGHPPSDFITLKKLKELFSEGRLYDAVPTKKSTKAVQGGGLMDYFGDLQDVMDDYSYLSRLDRDKKTPISRNPDGGDDVSTV